METNMHIDRNRLKRSIRAVEVDGLFVVPAPIMEAAKYYVDLEDELTKMRKILAAIPGKIVIEAKEKCGYSTHIKLMSPRGDAVSEAAKATVTRPEDAEAVQNAVNIMYGDDDV